MLKIISLVKQFYEPPNVNLFHFLFRHTFTSSQFGTHVLIFNVFGSYHPHPHADDLCGFMTWEILQNLSWEKNKY